jgi:hypothetical protein
MTFAPTLYPGIKHILLEDALDILPGLLIIYLGSKVICKKINKKDCHKNLSATKSERTS